MDYTRPELNDEDVANANTYAAVLFRKNGLRNVTKILSVLILENIKLAKEVNEHRAARGIAPLETFEV